jgi:hypothetical protein
MGIHRGRVRLKTGRPVRPVRVNPPKKIRKKISPLTFFNNLFFVLFEKALIFVPRF